MSKIYITKHSKEHLKHRIVNNICDDSLLDTFINPDTSEEISRLVFIKKYHKINEIINNFSYLILDVCGIIIDYINDEIIVNYSFKSSFYSSFTSKYYKVDDFVFNFTKNSSINFINIGTEYFSYEVNQNSCVFYYYPIKYREQELQKLLKEHKDDNSSILDNKCNLCYKTNYFQFFKRNHGLLNNKDLCVISFYNEFMKQSYCKKKYFNMNSLVESTFCINNSTTYMTVEDGVYYITNAKLMKNVIVIQKIICDIIKKYSRYSKKIEQ